MLCHALAGYSLTHTSSVVGRNLVSNVTTTHVASNGVGTNLTASTYTQSTFVYVCEVRNCDYDIKQLLTVLSLNHIVSCTCWIFSYPCKFCCQKRFGIRGNNYTHSFHWCWYNSDCNHLYSEHIHLCLCDMKMHS